MVFVKVNNGVRWSNGNSTGSCPVNTRSNRVLTNYLGSSLTKTLVARVVISVLIHKPDITLSFIQILLNKLFRDVSLDYVIDFPESLLNVDFKSTKLCSWTYMNLYDYNKNHYVDIVVASSNDRNLIFIAVPNKVLLDCTHNFKFIFTLFYTVLTNVDYLYDIGIEHDVFVENTYDIFSITIDQIVNFENMYYQQYVEKQRLLKEAIFFV